MVLCKPVVCLCNAVTYWVRSVVIVPQLINKELSNNCGRFSILKTDPRYSMNKALRKVSAKMEIE